MSAHGTTTRYKNHACRCSMCKAAWSAYLTAYRAGYRHARNPSNYCATLKSVDRNALMDLLQEVCPDGLTSAEERAMHGEGALL